MRATCPSCEAVYEIPDRLVGAGRRLRCANCGHEWTLSQPAAEAATIPSGASPPRVPASPHPPPAYTYAPTPEPAAAPPRPTRPMLRRPPQVIDPPLPPADDGAGLHRRGEVALWAAWAGSVLLVVVALAGLWTFRHEIAAAWPPAARLVGAPVSGG